MLAKAVALHQSGDINGAIDAYCEYLALRPDSLIALSNLGAAYANVGRYEDAVKQYRAALGLQPDSLPVEMNLALAYYKSGRTEKAAPIFEKVHAAAPDQLQPTILLADCWLTLGRNKDVADLLRPLEQRLPDDAVIDHMLGTALVRDNQIVRGQTLIEKILRNGDSAEARLLIGTIKINARDYRGAIEDLSKALELNAKLPDVHYFYGFALLSAGDTDRAGAAFQLELEVNPNNFDSNLQLGVLLISDDKYAEALQHLRRALQLRPGDLAVRFQLAVRDVDQDRLESARAELEALVKESRTFTPGHVMLATVYYRLERKSDGGRDRALVRRLNAENQPVPSE
jgi:tetratricopeptide (TPR) repeat protein